MLDYDCVDGGCVGVHDCLGKVGGYVAACYQGMIGFLIIVIVRVVFRVHDVEIYIRVDFQACVFIVVFDDIGMADQDWGFGCVFYYGLCRVQNLFIFALGKDDVA